MPSWSGLVLTRQGIAAHLRAVAGETLTLTHIKIGSGVVTGNTNMEDMSDLVKAEQTLNISSKELNADKTNLAVSAVTSNAGLETGYYIKELGVFAQDMDDASKEILYAYTADTAPDFLPADNGTVTVSQAFQVYIDVSNIEDASATIDVGGWCTSGYVRTQIDTHNSDTNAHSDMVGATSTATGVHGWVPAPAAGKQDKFLRGDGSWEKPTDTTYSNFTGSKTTVDGTNGLVPKPTATTYKKVLCSDGTWVNPGLLTFPVGSVQIFFEDIDPNVVYGGTWVRIAGRMIMAAGANEANSSSTYGSCAAGTVNVSARTTGGEASHTLGTSEMPSHNHSEESAGEHTHERGTMNITGAFGCDDRSTNLYKGAFYPKWNQGTSDTTADGGDGASIGMCFDASKSWEGKTSSNGSHTHTIKNTGDGKAHNNMPPFIALNIWRRTA